MGLGGRRLGGVGAVLAAAAVSLLGSADAIPHYYINGYGCAFTAVPSEWATHMKITEPAVQGNVHVVNGSLHYDCPPEYGILLKLNTSLADVNSTSNWISSSRCDNTFYRGPYSNSPIKPNTLPVLTEYMCATHNRNVWYAGAFTVDRAFEVQEAQPSTMAMFAGAYSSDSYYRGMYYAAASILLSAIIVIAATRAPRLSTLRRLGIGAHFALAAFAAVWLWVAVLNIATATPRPWPNRIVHASLGWFTLIVISAAIVLGALAFWGKVRRMLYKAVAVLAVLLTIATSAVALANFYDYDSGFVIGWSALIGAVIVYAALIPENTVSAPPPKANQALYTPVDTEPPTARRSTRVRSAFI